MGIKGVNQRSFDRISLLDRYEAKGGDRLGRNRVVGRFDARLACCVAIYLVSGGLRSIGPVGSLRSALGSLRSALGSLRSALFDNKGEIGAGDCAHFGMKERLWPLGDQRNM